MNDVISKAILSGLGFASLTRDAIVETANALVKQSKMSEREGRRLVKEFQVRSKSAQKVLEKKVNEAVSKAVKALELEEPHRAAKKAKGGAKRKTAARWKTTAGRRKTARKSKA